VIGAATLTTAQPRHTARGDQSGRWQTDPYRRRAAPRSGSGAAALPGVTTCGRPRSYGLRQVDAEAATMPTKPAEPSASSMTRSSSPSAAVNKVSSRSNLSHLSCPAQGPAGHEETASWDHLYVINGRTALADGVVPDVRQNAGATTDE
jgi:hypothetical protein